MVVKKDGAREVFNRTKIVAGIQRACHKRPVPVAAMEQTVEAIERDLHETGEKEVSSNYIGERVMESLRGLDGVAYVRFASVYRSFRDLNEFIEEVKHLLAKDEVPS